MNIPRKVHFTAISALRALSLLSLTFALAMAGCSSDRDSSRAALEVIEEVVVPEDAQFPGYEIITLEDGEDLETRALEALIMASPKTIVELPAGNFDFVGELSVTVDSVVLRGTGMSDEGGTVINFANQTTGSQGILATGDNFVVQDLAVLNTPGDGIKINGSNGVTIQRVRVEWTNGADENNGAYGLYPVQTRNVLIEDSEVRGASDAGVYVGQSEKIIVRNNFVYENVAGIEIENSKFADVYDNETTANTGGILVFDLPGPPVQGGEATRVFNNKIHGNNTLNFAPEGNIVGIVPTGTGILIMANDDVEVFGNEIRDNQSIGVAVVSYYINDVGISKPSYDPVPEKIFLHDNEFSNNATDPLGLAAAIFGIAFGGEPLEIYYDNSGVSTDAGLLLEFPDGLTEDQLVCSVDNGDVRIGRANASVVLAGLPFSLDISTDPADFVCTHASLPEIVLEQVTTEEGGEAIVDTEALCSAEGEGINASAFEADCPNLSDYRLFVDSKDPTANANDGFKYDLTTALFTDYAEKHRFVFIPEGAAAAYRSVAVFDFPVGTIISKTFAIQSDLRDDSSSQDIIETRLLIKRSTGWKALPYIWDDARTEAVLTVTGGTKSVSWIDINGEERSTDYVIPNSNNCSNCHGEETLLPIGPKASLLNKLFDYGTETTNQISFWAGQGMLTGAPDDTSSIVTIPLEDDLNADLESRARGYLDVNCAHCHSPGGAGDTSGLFLEFGREFGLSTGECKPPVAAGDGAGSLEFAIVPGDADSSILPFRMDSNEPDVRMPEIGRSIIHTQGVALIREWIDALAADDCR